jgi:hypothetical protein
VDHAAVVGELQADVGARERDAAEHVVAVGELGGFGLEELPPRGGVVVEVGDVDHCALVERRRLGLAPGLDAPGVARALGAAGDAGARHRGDGRQRLAAKPHRAHALEVVEGGDLAGGVALERERELVARDAAAVVGDADAPHAALLELHLDRARASIDRVLEYFLEHRGRALDHLAGGDLVDQQVGEAVDVGHGGGGDAKAGLYGGAGAAQPSAARAENRRFSLPAPGAWRGSGIIAAMLRGGRPPVRAPKPCPPPGSFHRSSIP